LTNGYLSFGSFNRLGKITAPAVRLWSQLLKAIPDSRMVLGGMPQDGQTGMLIDWFGQGGIDRERLTFFPRRDLPGYLALHGQVDLCLDTFPYAGGTTVNHALWMGVPTLTLAGGTAPSRQGAAMLGHVGLDTFVANHSDDFVAKGHYWARNIPELSTIRSGLRDRSAQAPIRRPELVAAGLEIALRTMWRRWCSGMPPASFEAMPQADRTE
jgi:predicted O-linked N-acetylglucosamine transferase (SPINDLY family)